MCEHAQSLFILTNPLSPWLQCDDREEVWLESSAMKEERAMKDLAKGDPLAQLSAGRENECKGSRGGSKKPFS